MNKMDKINFLKKIAPNNQKQDSWLEQRKKRLTSSDCATALGINPYEEPIGLLFKKCGVNDAFKGNAATKHGEKYETEAINWYCKLMNKKNYEYGLVDYDSLKSIRKPSKLDTISFSTEFLAGSPDGVAIDNDDSEDLVLLEVKCPMYRKLKFGYIPEYYYPQVQLNMAILDLKKADFIEYIPARETNVAYGYITSPLINIVRIHRDDDWLIENIYKLSEFWKQILYWREVGIKMHPEYNIFLNKSTKKSAYDNEHFNEKYEDDEICEITFRCDSESDNTINYIKNDTDLVFRENI